MPNIDPALKYLNPEELARRGTASDFARWVYEKYHPHSASKRADDRKREERMKIGIATHDDIERMRLWADENVQGNSHYWELLYADSHASQSSDRVFLASYLPWNGYPVRCRPDVVLRNKDSGEVVIIERKVTTGGHVRWASDHAYARIRAQLWCYAWIDEWRDAPEVYLVCEWWAAHKKSKQSPSWRRSDRNLHRNCRDLWEEYGGKWVGPKLDVGKIRNIASVPEFRDWLDDQVTEGNSNRDILSAVSSEWLLALQRMNGDDKKAVIKELTGRIKSRKMTSALNELVINLSRPDEPIRKATPTAIRQGAPAELCPRCRTPRLLIGPCEKCGL